MARFLSTVYSTIHGSVNGLTYFPGPYHQLQVRSRTTPVQPNTTPQNRIRGAFNQAQNWWLTLLTQTQRDAWQAYAATCTYQGPVGQYIIPGRQMFVAVHGLRTWLTNSLGIGFPNFDYDAPNVPGFLNSGDVIFSNPTSGNTGIQITVANTNPEPVFALGQISRPWNPTKNFFRGPYLNASNVANLATASSVVTYSRYGLTEDLAYFVRHRLISASDVTHTHLRISQDAFHRFIAVTTP